MVADRSLNTKTTPLSARLPSPVRKLSVSSSGDAELWLKDDSAINALYGGNKVRKLQLILPHAQARGAKRLVTFGAVGSHHVLASTLLGAGLGLPLTAFLFKQPSSDHVLDNLKAALAAGLDAHPVSSLRAVPLALARNLKSGDYLIPAGGSGPIGSDAFYRAASELAGQIDGGLLPVPDVIVVPFGSGGTSAGLLAGLVACGLSSLVCAVDVSLGGRTPEVLIKGLATWLATRHNLQGARKLLATKLVVEPNYRGRGYGFDTPAGNRALAIAADWGLQLDQTYTSKAFAKALELGPFPGYDPKCWPDRQAREPLDRLRRDTRASGRTLRVLYWHTLSSTRPPVPPGFQVPDRLMKQLLTR